MTPEWPVPALAAPSTCAELLHFGGAGFATSRSPWKELRRSLDLPVGRAEVPVHNSYGISYDTDPSGLALDQTARLDLSGDSQYHLRCDA